MLKFILTITLFVSNGLYLQLSASNIFMDIFHDCVHEINSDLEKLDFYLSSSIAGDWQVCPSTDSATHHVKSILPQTVSSWATSAHANSGNGTLVQFVASNDSASLGISDSTTYYSNLNEITNPLITLENLMMVSQPLEILTVARDFAVFHSAPAGEQEFSFNNSLIWGKLGIDEQVKVNFSGGSTLIGDCVSDPFFPTSPCLDIDQHTGNTVQEELSAVTADIVNAITEVRALTPTEIISGDLSGGTTVTSSGVGAINVVEVTGKVSLSSNDVTISGSPTDYFYFNVLGDFSSSGGQIILSGGIPASNIIWVIGGRIQTSGNGGWKGALLADKVKADNAADNLDVYDGTMYIVDGKLSYISGGRFRWHPYTIYDYGDAPNSYGTAYDSVNGSSRHKIVENGPTLGSNLSSESNGGSPTNTETDDDGISAPINFIKNQNGEISVIVNNPSTEAATLNGWLDLDGNGTFDSNEKATIIIPAMTSNTVFNLNFGTIPNSAPNATYLRLRISSDAAAIENAVTPIPTSAPAPDLSDNPMFPLDNSAFSGNDAWPDGEVEDYAVTITGCLSPTASATDATCTGSTVNADGMITIAGFNTGDRYDFNTGVTYLGSATFASGSTPIPVDGIIANNLANGSQEYTIRIFEANGCFIDRNVTINETTCTTCNLTINTENQSVCNNNSTIPNGADDYFTITVTATAMNTASTQYQVVIGAAVDGTGGTILGTANYGTAITVGDGTNGATGTFLANNASTYTVTIRDATTNTCIDTFTTTAVTACSNCPAPVCLPVGITINPAGTN